MPKKLRKIFIVVLIIFCILFAMMSIDYILVNNQKNPVCCPFKSRYQDGGTMEYYGFLGYKVISFNKLGMYEYNGESFMTAYYVYWGNWGTTYQEAWAEVEDEAIKRGYESYKKAGAFN